VYEILNFSVEYFFFITSSQEFSPSLFEHFNNGAFKELLSMFSSKALVVHGSSLCW
jgi:hypothetical protein